MIYVVHFATAHAACLMQPNGMAEGVDWLKCFCALGDRDEG